MNETELEDAFFQDVEIDVVSVSLGNWEVSDVDADLHTVTFTLVEES